MASSDCVVQVFAVGKVEYVYQPLGIIVAETPALAAQGAALVAVEYAHSAVRFRLGPEQTMRPVQVVSYGWKAMPVCDACAASVPTLMASLPWCSGFCSPSTVDDIHTVHPSSVTLR